MSLGHVGSFCGCGEGMGCADCQGFGSMHEQLVPVLWPRSNPGMRGPVPLYPHNPPQGFRGMGAGKTSGQTNYWPLGTHRTYAVRPGLPQQTGLRGMGAIDIGGGWTLADVSSLAMIAIAAMTIFGKGRKL